MVANCSWLLSQGAGISVGAGIPDFRSPDGLFQTIKRDNPKESLSSGRDLFDASVFNVSDLRYFGSVRPSCALDGDGIYRVTLCSAFLHLIFEFSP